MFMLTHTMGSLIIPLLTLTYILQIPAILFTGFSSFKFKDTWQILARSMPEALASRGLSHSEEKVQLTLYQYKIALCYNSANCALGIHSVIVEMELSRELRIDPKVEPRSDVGAHGDQSSNDILLCLLHLRAGFRPLGVYVFCTSSMLQPVAMV